LRLKCRHGDQRGAHREARQSGKEEYSTWRVNPEYICHSRAGHPRIKRAGKPRFKAGDRFDGSGPGSHLAESTRRNLWISYARFLGFISANRQDLLDLPPEARIDRLIAANYVAWRRRACGDEMVAVDLQGLRGALRLICPGVDWPWLLTISKRIAAAAPRKPRKYHLVTSDHLYVLGIELMDHALADADAAKRISKAQAFEYRDGLVIALLALIPVRSRTLVALRIGKQLVKAGDLWALDIPAADTKTRRLLDYPISQELSARIDLYLERFRRRIPGADKHSGLWASNKRRPMSAIAIYNAVRRRTKKAFGFAVNLHRFRHAAASFWSIRDPVNVRGVKDLLGQDSFGITEKHYIMGQSRLAGRALARIVEAARTYPGNLQWSARHAQI
jgi:integrase/recombinase XerD